MFSLLNELSGEIDVLITLICDKSVGEKDVIIRF